jgi:prophage antirepressor-like protein
MEKQQSHQQIALFRGRKIRKIRHNKEWWFSILDVIMVLTDGPQPKTYWAKMKERDQYLSQSFPIWEQLKLESSDGKKI